MSAGVVHGQASGPDVTARTSSRGFWSVADLLRGDYRQSEYGRATVPMTVLRRLDCVLEPTKQQVLDRFAQLECKVENIERVLLRTSGSSAEIDVFERRTGLSEEFGAVAGDGRIDEWATRTRLRRITLEWLRRSAVRSPSWPIASGSEVDHYCC
jgi:hypothetical protein